MNRIAVLITALAAFGIAVANVILGQRLILPLPVATERGAEVPWYLAWGMVWVSVMCAAALGVFLISSTLRSGRR